VAGRAGEELPAKAISLALRLSLGPNVPNITYLSAGVLLHRNAEYAHKYVR
jgi:hypothetical protein